VGDAPARPCRTAQGKGAGRANTPPVACSAALVRALARVLLAAGGDAALAADLLAAAFALDLVALGQLGRGRTLAVGLGDDLVAHGCEFLCVLRNPPRYTTRETRDKRLRPPAGCTGPAAG